MDQRLNVKPKTIKHREKFHDIGFRNDSFNMTPKAKATKVKIHKLNYIKIKNFCSSRNTINRVERQPTEKEKMFANPGSDNGLISRTPTTSTTKNLN